LRIILFGLRTTNKLFGTIVGDSCARLVSFILIHLLYVKIKIKNCCSRIDIVCTPIYSFLASGGKYLEPATALHPIEAEGYEIRLYFISLVRELNFAGGLDEKLYKHL
jgi:hypothetical protein